MPSRIYINFDVTTIHQLARINAAQLFFLLRYRNVNETKMLREWTASSFNTLSSVQMRLCEPNVVSKKKMKFFDTIRCIFAFVKLKMQFGFLVELCKVLYERKICSILQKFEQKENDPRWLDPRWLECYAVSVAHRSLDRQQGFWTEPEWQFQILFFTRSKKVQRRWHFNEWHCAIHSYVHMFIHIPIHMSAPVLLPYEKWKKKNKLFTNKLRM